MTRWVPEINGAAIVLLGSFNPTILQPEWFVRQNLLPQTEVEKATIKIISPQVCDFETARFQVQVTQQRFAVISKADANPAPLQDIVCGTFYILEHTPVTALGLNRQMHFQLKTEKDWHNFGDQLAPKEGWGKVLPGRPGMLNLSIQAAMGGPDAPKGGPAITVKVQPSVQVKQFGVYFEVNENYPDSKPEALKNFMEIIKGRWEESYNYAAEIADGILSWTSRGKDD
jgi:hypothetical protein